MKYTSLLFILIFTLGLVLGVSADDAAAGAAELKLLNDVFTGNIGYAIGFFVCLSGLITIIRGSLSAGVTLIVVGVLITLTPAVFSAAHELFCPMLEVLTGATCTSIG